MRRYVRKHELLNELIILLVGLGALTITTLSPSLTVHVVSLWFVWIAAAFMSDFDLLHPYTSYALVYSLYATSHAILWQMGLRAGNYNREQILYAIIGLVTVLLVIGSEKVPDIRISAAKDENNDYKYMDWIILATSLFTLAASVLLLNRGYSGKTEMIRNRDLFFRIGVYTARYTTIFSMLRYANLFLQKRRFIWQLLLGTAACFLFGLVTGERDAYIRYAVCGGIMLYAAGVIKRKHFVILIPLGMLFMGLSNYIKYFLVRGVLRGSFTLNTVIQNFLSSDFSAAGRNLQDLVQTDGIKGCMGIKLIFTELLYPFIPGSMRINPDVWFNYTFHTDSYHGRAFTLIGTGYIIGGAAGVILVFLIVGVFIRCVYNRSNKSTFGLTAYIYSLSIVMFASRESLNTIVNSFLKEICIAYLVFFVANNLLRREKVPNIRTNRRELQR